MTLNGVLLVEPLGCGGVWEYSCHLANALQRHVQVTVLTATDYDPSFLGPDVIVLPYVRWQRVRRWWHIGAVGASIRKILNVVGYLTALAQAFRRCQAGSYPLVHFQGLYWPPLVLSTALAVRFNGRHFAYTPHNSFSRDSSAVLRWLWIRWQRWIVRFANPVIVHTSFDRNALVDVSIGKARQIEVIPLGPYGGTSALVSRDEARGRLKLSLSYEYILLFGYLRPDKGLGELLAVLPQLVAEIQTSRLLVVGVDVNGFGASLINSLAAAMRAHVEFRPGFVPSACLADYFGASDVICLPYRQASDSAVARWAIAQQRPIVAYAVGGLRDALGNNRLIRWVKAGDRRGLLVELLTLLGSRSRDRAHAESITGPPLSTWPEIADLTLTTYRSALDAQNC